MKKLKIIFVITLVTIFFFLFYHYNGTVTEGYFTVNEEDIIVESDKTFLFLDNNKIEVPQNLVDNIKSGERHHIRFSGNRLFKNNTELDIIEADNT
ncbi:hypothetical protein [Paraliobacillus sp. X-1268]|uniref:hypothetical protein n=1 Tax=Paraliobacillus sp. X-1268 TaxID=2213193 RepID=UPI000E3B9075|nr:hypothetical protein [Paraliobacillus sp. X-1268]